jgi:hypothetical protein
VNLRVRGPDPGSSAQARPPIVAFGLAGVVKGGGDTGAGCLFLLGRAHEPGLDLLRPVQGIEFLAADALGPADPWLVVPDRHSGAQRAGRVVRRAEGIRGMAKLDPFFERTSKLASRRLKREIERRGTLGEFALEADPSTKGILPEESGSDLLRSDGPNAVALSTRVESPQSVVQGYPAQGSAVGPGEKEF